MLITLDDLITHRACEEWKVKFHTSFPNGLVLTTKEDVVKAIREGFGPVISWFRLFFKYDIPPNLLTIDLYGWDLSGTDLSGLDLRWVDFERSDLTNVNFSNSNLKRANLGYANLRGAIFEGANLNYTIMPSSMLPNQINLLTTRKH